VLSAINHESILSEENLQKAFNLMDVDKSGSLSVAEIKSALMYTRGALSEEQLGNLVKAVDINGDGTIQFDEFVQFMR
jgi:calmodulin